MTYNFIVEAGTYLDNNLIKIKKKLSKIKYDLETYGKTKVTSMNITAERQIK